VKQGKRFNKFQLQMVGVPAVTHLLF